MKLDCHLPKSHSSLNCLEPGTRTHDSKSERFAHENASGAADVRYCSFGKRSLGVRLHQCEPHIITMLISAN